MRLDLLELSRPLLEPGGHKVVSMCACASSDLLTVLPLLCNLLSRLELGIRHIELLLAHLARCGVQLHHCRTVLVVGAIRYPAGDCTS